MITHPTVILRQKTDLTIQIYKNNIPSFLDGQLPGVKGGKREQYIACISIQMGVIGYYMTIPDFVDMKREGVWASLVIRHILLMIEPEKYPVLSKHRHQ